MQRLQLDKQRDEGMTMLKYALLQPAVQRSDLHVTAQYMFALMMRNMASDGFVFSDPFAVGQFSAPGCIVASPSFAGDLSTVNQDYVYNWTRDAAVAAMEIALAHQPVGGASGSGPLSDYVNFAATCQQNTPTLAWACYTIEGQRRQDWPEQNDGPALQTLAVLQAFSQLDPSTQDTARVVIARNVDFILKEYQNPNYNLWEETKGQSFFTRSTQLKALTELQANSLGIPVPADVGPAADWLRGVLQTHWNGEYYVSILDAQNPSAGYDPNIDIVMACVYGTIDCSDPQLLATAARLRQLWTDPTPPGYPINQQDQANDLGPMLGRYPGDDYDGDGNHEGTGHPWALCTANFAQLYYTLAAAITGTGRVPYSPLSADFFSQIGIGQNTTPANAAARLQAAGDKMLQAIVFHSDHLELSEQLDRDTGYEKSVRDLTWSYAAFISAARTRATANQVPNTPTAP
jgi:glucoamylase